MGGAMTAATPAPQLPPGSVVITPNQMYDEMRRIGDEVKHLSSVIDPALAEMRRDIAELQAERKASDLRLRTIENWRWFVLGIAAVLGIVASTGVSWVIDVVRR